MRAAAWFNRTITSFDFLSMINTIERFKINCVLRYAEVFSSDESTPIDSKSDASAYSLSET